MVSVCGQIKDGAANPGNYDSCSTPRIMSCSQGAKLSTSNGKITATSSEISGGLDYFVVNLEVRPTCGRHVVCGVGKVAGAVDGCYQLDGRPCRSERDKVSLLHVDVVADTDCLDGASGRPLTLGVLEQGDFPLSPRVDSLAPVEACII